MCTPCETLPGSEDTTSHAASTHYNSAPHTADSGTTTTEDTRESDVNNGEELPDMDNSDESPEDDKDPEEDFRKICFHLERSNKPSSMAMMMLKDLKSGNVIDGQSTKAPAIGSYLHKQD